MAVYAMKYIYVDVSTVVGVLDAARLSSGGLDKGGMWELVSLMEHNMKGHELPTMGVLSGTQTEAEAEDGRSTSQPKPFSRKTTAR